MKYKKLSFFGIDAVIKSDDNCFLDAVESGLYFFNKEKDKNPSLAKGQGLHVTYLKNQKDNPARLVRGSYKIGNNVYMRGNTCVFIDGNLIVQIIKSEGMLEVVAQPFFKKGIKGVIRETFIPFKADYFLLMRKLILFPIFNLLERRCNVFLLHGSAISHEDQGIVMAGLAGVGKTTLAVSLSLQLSRHVKFLSDNFLLFDEDHIYPFPEHIRLHDDLLDFIDNVSNLGKPIVRRYNRNHYMIKEQCISGKVVPRIVLILRLADSYYIKQISVNVAIDRLLLANDHVKEFHMYHYSGLLDYLNYETKSIYRKRVDTLEKILSKTSVYEVSVIKGQKPCEWWEQVTHDIF